MIHTENIYKEKSVIVIECKIWFIEQKKHNFMYFWICLSGSLVVDFK